MCLSPSDSFPPQNAADLTAFDRDAGLLSRLCQRVETPLGRALLVAGHHRPVPLRHQSSRSWLAHRRDELAVILNRQAARPPRLGPIAQPFNPFGIEAVQPSSHGLRTTPHLLGDGAHSLSIPTPDYDARMQYPVGWPVSTRRQFAHPALDTN